MRKFFGILIVFMVTLNGAGEKKIEIDIIQEIQSRNYENAANLIKKNQDVLSPKNYYQYLLGNSYAYLKKYPEAEEVYGKIISAEPDSLLSIKSKYKLAQIYYAKRDFEKSYALLEKQINFLSSKKRRQKFTDIYAKLAHENAFHAEEAKRNYQLAADYYKKALDIGNLSPSDDELLAFNLGRTYGFQRRHYDAIKIFSDFIAKNPQSKLLDEVYFYLGESYYNARNYWSAREYWRKLVEVFPRSKLSARAFYMLGKTFYFPAPATILDLELGAGYLQTGYQSYQDPEYSPLCAYEIGEAYSRFSHLKHRAITAYQTFIRQFPKHEKAGQALFNLAQHYFELGDHENAIKNYRQFITDYQNNQLFQQVQNRLIQSHFARGKKEHAAKNWEKAAGYLREYIELYPLDYNVSEAMFLLGDILFEQKKYPESIRQYYDLYSRYPSNTFALNGMLAAADIYISKLEDYEKGVETYKKIHYGPQRATAENLIKALNSEFLQLNVKKLFLSHQSPKINLKVRNSPEVKINVYNLNLLDYFYKSHTIKGIENLDILLIKPNLSIDFKVPDFKKMKTYELDHELPISEPGSYVVQLVSDELTSTAMVLKSDLSLFSRANRNEVFVYVKNLRQGRGEKQAEVYVSNGQKIILQGKTDELGIFRGDIEKLAKNQGISIEKLSVFAKSGNNFASNELSLQGVTFNSGTKTQAYIYGDKSVYRPGDLIHFKAIIREISAFGIKHPSLKEYKVHFYSPSGNRVYTRTLSLDEAGALSGDIRLDRAIRTGEGRLSIHFADGSLAFSKEITLLKYEAPQSVINIETDRETYFPGDKIKITLKAQKFFGLPYSRQNIMLRVLNEPVVQLKTDKKGVAVHTIDTQKYGMRESIYLRLVLSDGTTLNKTIPFKPHNFQLQVKTARKLYISEEEVAILVRAKDLKNKPLDKKLELQIHRLEGAEQILIKKSELKTSRGKAELKLKLSEGGRYQVTASALGKNNIPVTVQHNFSLADQKDHRKIFIMNEEKEFQSDKENQLKIFSRIPADSALLVISGEEIFSTREINLKKGHNAFPLKIEGRYAPQVRVSLILLSAEGSYFADRDFSVKKEVRFVLSNLKKSYKPGETVSFEINALNQSGTEVPSFISLAVVDEAVYQAHAGKMGKIQTHFYPARKLGNFRVGGFSPYSYSGITMKRNKEILTENLERHLALTNRDEATQEDLAFKKESARPSQYASRSLGGARAKIMAEQQADRIMESERDDSFDAEKEEPMMEETEGQALRTLFRETAYYKAHLALKGKQKISFKLPDNVTRWRVVVIGSSGDDLFGNATAHIMSTKPALIELDTPSTLLVGDKIKLGAQISNAGGEERSASYSLSVGEKLALETHSGNYMLGPKSSGRVTAGKSHSVTKAGKLFFRGEIPGDSMEKSISARPWSQRQSVGVSGYTDKSLTRDLEVPKEFTERKLVFKLFPATSEVLEKIRHKRDPLSLPFTSEVAARLLNDLSLYRVLKKETAQAGKLLELTHEIEQKILQLQSYTLQDGSFNWIRFIPTKDINPTLFNYYVLASAKKIGFKIDEEKIKQSGEFLFSAFHKTVNLEEKALILWALNQYQSVEYSYINRLYRSRASLSGRGLALLTLIMMNENRLPEADTLSLMLISKKQGNLWKSTLEPGMEFLNSDREVSALAVMALLRSQKDPALIQVAIKNLLSELEREQGAEDLFSAIFSSIYADYLITYPRGQGEYELSLKVNEKLIFTKTFSAQSGYFTTTVASRDLRDKNKIELLLNGQGQISYAAHIYYSRPNYVKEKTKDFGVVDKYYLYPNYVLDGKIFQQGFSSLAGRETVHKPQILKKVNLYNIFPVKLDFRVSDYKEKYLILKDTIPSGCRLVPGSVKGEFVYYRQKGNTLTFYLIRSAYSRMNITYELMAGFEGEFRALPPRLFPLHKPEKVTLGPISHIKIENQDFDTFAPYQFSPDELFALGAHYYQNENFKKAEETLEKLIAKFQLKDEIYIETSKMLLYINLKAQKSREVVKYFDILRERNPDLELDLGDIIKIARTYVDIEEYERAYLLLKDVLDAYFSQESQLGAILVRSERIKDSVGIMKELFRQYPDTSLVQSVFYSFGQELNNRFSGLGALDKKGEKGNLYYTNARNILFDFLTEYPDYASADEVSFTLLNLILDKQRYADLNNASRLFTARYPGSKFLSDFKYLSAFALYELGNFNESLKFAKEVAYNQFKDADGVARFSENKNFALHMLAKIYHALGNIESAIEEYRKVSAVFADAKNSIEFIQNKNIFVPEITKIKPGETSHIEVRSKGIGHFELKLYKVDFVILCLGRTDFSNMRNVNLTGISPTLTKKINITNISDDLVNSKVEVPVKDAGSYLLVLKSDEVETTGVLLATDLREEVQTDRGGRVRILVRNGKGERVKDVKLFSIGSAQKQFIRSQSDLRGISEIEGVVGIPTVFGEYQGNYIFHRGNVAIGQEDAANRPAQPSSAQEKEDKPNNLYNIQKRRQDIQQERSKQFDLDTKQDIKKYKLRSLMK